MGGFGDETEDRLLQRGLLLPVGDKLLDGSKRGEPLIGSNAIKEKKNKLIQLLISLIHPFNPSLNLWHWVGFRGKARWTTCGWTTLRKGGLINF